MRVTTGAFTNHYLKNTNTALENQLKIIDRIQSQRKYNRASEDSVSAAKAAHIRKSLANLDIYDENVNNAKELYKAAEDMLYDIANEAYLTVNERLISAQSTKDQDQLNILAQEIEQKADHMLQDMNADFGERQMFGSTSNDKTPFTVFSYVKVLDSSGNEIASFGNLPDTAKTAAGDAVSFMIMNDESFYDKDGNVVDLTAASAGDELYDSEGNKYNVVADGSGSVKDAVTGQTYDKIYPNSQQFYDEEGNVIDVTASNFTGSVYYDGPDKNTAVKFTVNGEADGLAGMDSRVVCYNDVPVNLSGDDLLNAVQGGTLVYYDKDGNYAQTKTINTTVEAGAKGTAEDFPGAGPIYVDIGLGINYSKLDSTALDISLNGAKMTGCGTDKEGDARNIIQLCYDAANALRSGDLSEVNKYIDKVTAARNIVLSSITDLGIKQNNMDFYIDKNETFRLSLSEKQNDLEGCDLTEEITNWKSAEAAYNATLSMGSSSLPKSLFDFI
ncbi:MAG: hypothetical protein ACI4JJ_00495 [Huintestinicola sp.]